jgi:ParB-like chromosome segregation protein Spo0J
MDIPSNPAPRLPDEIERVPTGRLVPFARNSRTHSPEQVAQIAASIREFGFNNPVLIDPAGTIIAGHGRVMAARQLAMDEVPCIRLGHLSESQRRAYVIVDNKLALNAGWDEELLRSEVATLTEEGFDIPLLGFSADELTLIANGWEPVADVVDKSGENLDGIATTLRVMVEQEAEGAARAVIDKALTAAGITFDIKT